MCQSGLHVWCSAWRTDVAWARQLLCINIAARCWAASVASPANEMPGAMLV